MPDKKLVMRVGAAVIIVCLVVRGWDAVVTIAAAILTAAAPLVAGAAIAYVVNILMGFFERHLLPTNASPVVASLRPPACLAASFLLIVAFVVATASLLVPALAESFDMLGKRSADVVAWLRGYPPAQPLISTINGLTSGDILRDLSNLKIPEFLKQGLTNAMGPITEQLSIAATSVMTFFFGLLFSVWLLLDKHRVGNQVRRALKAYLGQGRYDKLKHVCAVFDRSYHGYIVRQCAEAVMLGVVSAIILAALGFPYALGISALVVFAALIPVVGIPTGVIVGAFLVITDTPLRGIAYLVAMFAAQGLVETFVMPHVGDPRILMSPVWVTVAVTLGGGICGFLGMIAATPFFAALHQLVGEGVKARESGRSLKATYGQASAVAGATQPVDEVV